MQKGSEKESLPECMINFMLLVQEHFIDPETSTDFNAVKAAGPKIRKYAKAIKESSYFNKEGHARGGIADFMLDMLMTLDWMDDIQLVDKKNNTFVPQLIGCHPFAIGRFYPGGKKGEDRCTLFVKSMLEMAKDVAADQEQYHNASYD